MKKYYLETFGCKLNYTDSQRIKNELDKEFKLTSLKEANFVILNTCAVVEKTERKIFKLADSLRKKGKIVVITGCLPMVSSECLNHADKIIGIKSINKINETIRGIENSCFKEFKKRCCFCEIKESSSVIIPIAEGCIGKCTYCISRIARKQLISFEINDIVLNVKKALDLGFKEIQLTSQDLSIYGLDKGKLLLPELLKELISIKGSFKIKLGMMNPGTTKKILKPLLKIYESDKLYKFIHIPLQSGDNEVLNNMKRSYKSEDFVFITKEFRKKFKEGVIATDIIVGHPTESEKAFNNTIKIIKKTKPDIVHTFKFSKRRGTPDFNLKDMPDRIKKQRSRELTKVFIEINEKRNKKFINKKYKTLVIKNNFGRNDSGRAIVADKGQIGYYEEVKITNSKWNYLIGKVVEN